MSEPTTEAGRALLAAYDPCYCEGTVCDVLPDLAARVAAIEAEAAQRSTAEVERLREEVVLLNLELRGSSTIRAALREIADGDLYGLNAQRKARAALAEQAE
jgi:hypothetical protein